jgi:hypothetical protein
MSKVGIEMSRRAALLARTFTGYGAVCFLLAFALSLPGQAQQAPSTLQVTDVSPDGPYGMAQDANGSDPSGRIVSLVIDPTSDSVLYGASTYSGVWKSTDGGKTWNQASAGLRSGFSVAGDNSDNGGPALSIDARNPKRLIYLTSEDGRPGVPCPGEPVTSQTCTLAGVWVSVDGAASWQHVNLPGCPRPAIVGSVFVSGGAFLLTNTTTCRLWSSVDPQLQKWQRLADPPFPGAEEIMAAENSSGTLFACQGNKVFRWPAQSFTPWSEVQTIGGTCRGLAAVPTQPRTAVVMYDAVLDGTPVGREVCIVAFETGASFTCNNSILQFSLFSSLSGSGETGVYIASLFGGSGFQIFAADGLNFFRYEGNQAGSNLWKMLQGLHVDTHGLVFPRRYNPFAKDCTAFAATDGGVFINTATQVTLPCAPLTGWVLASSGLHVYASEAMAGLSQTPSTCPKSLLACPILYDPSADDDVWASAQGGVPGSSWGDLHSALGDAAQVFVDPAQPEFVVSGRFGGGGCQIRFQFSRTGGPVTPQDLSPDSVCITPPNFAGGVQTPRLSGFSTVMTLPGESPEPFGDYLSYESVFSLGGNTCPKSGGCDDVIVRNTAAPFQTGSVDHWTDISPASHFGTAGRGHIGAVATSGGHRKLMVYVLITNAEKSSQAGQIWKGQIDSSGLVPSWSPASGNAEHPLVRAFNMTVNPYDPRELYASDLGDDTIKVSRDGGATWRPIPFLKDIATNYGEYTFGCGKFADGTAGSGIFQSACPLVDMAFNRDHPEIRVAALFPGGVAFSRDSGQHWAALNVTNAQPFIKPGDKFAESFDLIEMPRAVFYDPELNAFTGSASIFVALQGKGVIRVDGPFDKLASGRVYYCPVCDDPAARPGRFARVNAVFPALVLSVPLKPGTDGSYHGDFPFDSARVQHLDYYFTLDGEQTATFTKTLSAGKIAAGEAFIGNAIIPPTDPAAVDAARPPEH